jgi:hypothetical protein
MDLRKLNTFEFSSDQDKHAPPSMQVVDFRHCFDTPWDSLELAFDNHSARVLIRQYDDGETTVRFTRLEGGYLLYQCLRTNPRFRSSNYAHHEYKAANGIKIISKNSPLILDSRHLYLQGAFPDFDMKPSVMHVGDKFWQITNDLFAALFNFSSATLTDDFKPYVRRNDEAF